jgi:glycine cleavage system aminomethyltransferase T
VAVSAYSTAPHSARSTCKAADAAALLDRIYTNLMSNLKGGSIRYGVMCGVDGMVVDDGTVLRLAEDRFLVYTTTGGSAKSSTGWRSGCRPSGRSCRWHSLR